MRYFFLLLLLVLVFFELTFFGDIWAKVELLYERKNIYIAGYFTLVTFLGFLSITLFFFIKNRVLFTLFIALLFCTYAIDLVYKDINIIGFSFNDLVIAVNGGAAFAFDAFSTYINSIEKILLLLIIFFLILIIIRKIIVVKALHVSSVKVVVFFMVVLLLSYSITHKTTAESQNRPTLFKVINTGIYFISNQLYYGERLLLNAKPKVLAEYKNIIFIMDESIGGQYLSINGYEKDTTPYLNSIKNKYKNLGLASSASNCSDKSNIALMSGIQFNQLPDNKQLSLKEPSIFQYAKNAGYKTHYFSAQKEDMDLQNYMTKHDLQYIDNFSQLDAAYEHKVMPEENIILSSKKALANSAKNFIFIVKRGSHFQWEGAYPSTEKYFVPTLGAHDSLILEKREEALNSYLNSIQYNVDLFFKYFLKNIGFFERNDTLIIYTSDHGQSILEEGRVATHCDSTNPPKTQGIVPLLLFSNTDGSTIDNSKFKMNVYSHYEIFPTIQKLMGYEKLKGETLFDKVEGSQQFISGDIFGRGHTQFTTIK